MKANGVNIKYEINLLKNPAAFLPRTANNALDTPCSLSSNIVSCHFEALCTGCTKSTLHRSFKSEFFLSQNIPAMSALKQVNNTGLRHTQNKNHTFVVDVI